MENKFAIMQLRSRIILGGTYKKLGVDSTSERIIMAANSTYLTVNETDRLFVEISTTIFRQSTDYLFFDHLRKRNDDHYTDRSRKIRCEMDENYGTNEKLMDFSLWVRNFLVSLYKKHTDKKVRGPRRDIMKYLFHIARKYVKNEEYDRTEPFHNTPLGWLVRILRMYHARSIFCHPARFHDVLADIVAESSIMQDAPRGLVVSNIFILRYVHASPRLNTLYFTARDYYGMFIDLERKIGGPEYSLDYGMTFNSDYILKWPALMRNIEERTRYDKASQKTELQSLFRKHCNINFKECLKLDKRLTSFLVAIHMAYILHLKKNYRESLKYVKLINDKMMKECSEDNVTRSLNLTAFYGLPFLNKTVMLKTLTDVSDVYDFMLLEQVLPKDEYWPRPS